MKEKNTEHSVNSLTCVKCSTPCSMLAQFMLFESCPSDTTQGLDKYYSMWQCPKCKRYYLRDWITQWKSDFPEAAPYQLIKTYVLDDHLALKVLDLVAKCPNPMTRKPEKCTCKLHEDITLPHMRIPAIWLNVKFESVDTIDFPRGANFDIQTYGAEKFQKSYYRKRDP